jgi:hypothetical protein
MNCFVKYFVARKLKNKEKNFKESLDRLQRVIYNILK